MITMTNPKSKSKAKAASPSREAAQQLLMKWHARMWATSATQAGMLPKPHFVDLPATRSAAVVTGRQIKLPATMTFADTLTCWGRFLDSWFAGPRTTIGAAVTSAMGRIWPDAHRDREVERLVKRAALMAPPNILTDDDVTPREAIDAVLYKAAMLIRADALDVLVSGDERFDLAGEEVSS